MHLTTVSRFCFICFLSLQVTYSFNWRNQEAHTRKKGRCQISKEFPFSKSRLLFCYVLKKKKNLTSLNYPVWACYS